MIRKIENISKQIEDQIQIKELEVSNIIRDVPPIILILERGFVEMKSLVLSENFKTNSDEIHFFKETKPKLNIFTPEFINSINEGEIVISQIFRNFILAEKYGKVHDLKGVYSVVMAPADHPTTQKEIKSLQARLNEEALKRVFVLSLEEFSTAIRVHCPGKYLKWIDWFHDRYLNFEKV